MMRKRLVAVLAAALMMVGGGALPAVASHTQSFEIVAVGVCYTTVTEPYGQGEGFVTWTRYVGSDLNYASGVDPGEEASLLTKAECDGEGSGYSWSERGLALRQS